MSAFSIEHDGVWRAWVRWGGAATFVLVAHAAGAWIIAGQQPEASDGAMASAIMVELAPLPVAPASEPVDAEPGPEVSEAQPDPVIEADNSQEEAPPLPEPEVDMPPPPEPAEPIFDKAELQASHPKPEVVLPEQPPPQPAKKQPVSPRKVDPVKEKKQTKPQKKVATAPPPSQAASIGAPAAPVLGSTSASSTSPANWRGALLAHLNRAKRYPAEARQRREEGTVRLSFSIDRSGRVVSYQMVGSSGSTALDQEALSMIQRASPLPAPPAEVPGSRISLTVPVRFDIH